MSKKVSVSTSILFVFILIAAATVYPPFKFLFHRKWTYLFAPPVVTKNDINDLFPGLHFNMVYDINKGDFSSLYWQVDWSLLLAEYVLAIAIGIVLSFIISVFIKPQST